MPVRTRCAGFSLLRRFALPLLLAGMGHAAAAGPGTTLSAADTLRVGRLNALAERTAETKNVQLGWEHAAQARTLAHRIGYLSGELNSIRIMAGLAIQSGHFVAALRGYNEGIDLAKAHRQSSFYERFYAGLGTCALEMEQYPYAVEMLLTSLKYRHLYPQAARDTTLTGAATYASLAKAYLELKQYPKSMEACRRTFPAGPKAPSYPDVEVIMAELLRLNGAGRAASESALEHLRNARVRYHQLGDRHKEILALLTFSKFLANQDRPAESGEAAASAAAYARELRAVPVQVKALEYQARAAIAQRDYRAAYAFQREAAEKKDALFSQEKTLMLEKQQARFEVGQQQQRIQYLTRVNVDDRRLAEAQQGKVTALGYLLSASVLFLLVGSFIYGRLRRNRAQLSRVYHDLGETNTHLQVALEDISQKVVEKEVLVQEIHHRVKNNLQLVSSLLGWQSSVYPDPALVEALACSRARIQSMALVHELLYSADNLAEVRLDTYVSKLLKSLSESFNSGKCPVAINTAMAPLAMTAQQATPFGLLVNELVTNAYKHAFVGRCCGQMRVELRAGPDGNGFELVVLDDGVGMPEPDAERRDSLGTHLIQNLVGQLKATLVVEPNAPTGTKFIIRRARNLPSPGQGATAAVREALLA